MTTMAKRLLFCTMVIVFLAVSGSTSAAAHKQPREAGISAYVMMILDIFSGRDIGIRIRLFARGPFEKEAEKLIETTIVPMEK